MIADNNTGFNEHETEIDEGNSTSSQFTDFQKMAMNGVMTGETSAQDNKTVVS